MELASDDNIKLSRKIDFSNMRVKRETTRGDAKETPSNEDDDRDVNIK